MNLCQERLKKLSARLLLGHESMNYREYLQVSNLMNTLNESKLPREKALKTTKNIFLNLFSQYFISVNIS